MPPGPCCRHGQIPSAHLNRRPEAALGTTKANFRPPSAVYLRAMHYEGIEYVVRARPGGDEWTLLIYFPTRAALRLWSSSADREREQAEQRVEESTTGSNEQRRKGRSDNAP
jgi:hypothetical protein